VEATEATEVTEIEEEVVVQVEEVAMAEEVHTVVVMAEAGEVAVVGGEAEATAIEIVVVIEVTEEVTEEEEAALVALTPIIRRLCRPAEQRPPSSTAASLRVAVHVLLLPHRLQLPLNGHCI